jgi:hypothetical protein
MHKHFCVKCEAVVAEGDFDCGRDADHDDLKLCAKCVARVGRTRPNWATLGSRAKSGRHAD